MRYFIFLAFSCLSISAFGQTDKVSDAVSTSVGRILLYQDLNTRYEIGNVGLGHYYLPELINQEYKDHISKLSTEDRLRFVWGVISFAKLGAHGTEELTLLIKECCENEFVASANQYIGKANKYRGESTSYVDEIMVNRADFFLRSLKSFRAHNQ